MNQYDNQTPNIKCTNPCTETMPSTARRPVPVPALPILSHPRGARAQKSCRTVRRRDLRQLVRLVRHSRGRGRGRAARCRDRLAVLVEAHARVGVERRLLRDREQACLRRLAHVLVRARRGAQRARACRKTQLRGAARGWPCRRSARAVVARSALVDRLLQAGRWLGVRSGGIGGLCLGLDSVVRKRAYSGWRYR